MQAYFDIPNFLSLIHSAGDSRYDDCIRMLKDNFEIKFTFPKTSILEMGKDDKDDIMQWLTTMANGKGDFSWNVGYPNRPVKMDGIKDVPHLTSVYCLDSGDYNDVEPFANKGVLIVAKEGAELSMLSNLLVKANQYAKNIFSEVNKWDDIAKYASPCTDIIIVDQYILSSPELYAANIYQLVKSLSGFAKNEKVNIVIFTIKKNYDRITRTEFEPDWDSLYSEIRAKANKKCRPNVTFVTANANLLSEHDRTIFTNYKTFASGDSYNYFDNAGKKITNGRYLHVHSLADSDNMNDAIKFLEDMQTLISKIKSLNSSNIMKDKVCNFLTF